VCRPSTTSKYASKPARSRPPSASPNSVDYGLQVYLQTRSITGSKCMSRLARSRPASSHDHGLQVHISKLARLRPASLSPHSLDYGLHKCISNLPRSQSWCASLCSLNHSLQVCLQIRSITPSKCIFTLGRSGARRKSRSSPDRHFQAHLELITRAACSQSRYTVCRSVAVHIHR